MGVATSSSNYTLSMNVTAQTMVIHNESAHSDKGDKNFTIPLCKSALPTGCCHVGNFRHLREYDDNTAISLMKLAF